MKTDVTEPDYEGGLITPDLPSGSSGVTEMKKPRTVGDVLDLFKEDPRYPHFCSTFNRFADYLKVPVPDAKGISLDLVNQKRRKFSLYLANHQISAAITARHIQNLNCALSRAENNGWDPDETMSPQSRQILDAAKSCHCDDVLRDFDRAGISPDKVTVALLRSWEDAKVIDHEHTFLAATRRASRFGRLLRRLRLLRQPPSNPRYAPRYGIPLRNFPSPMKEETETLVASRTNGPDLIDDEDLTGTWEDDTRRRQGQKETKPTKPIRSVSAIMLLSSVCRTCGYVRRILRRKEIISLKQLFTQEFFDLLLEYLKSRSLTSNSIRSVFLPMIQAIRSSSYFDPDDFLWLPDFVARLPKPTQAELENWRARHHVDYSVVETIPDMIEENREIINARKITTSGAPMFLSERVAIYSARLFMRSLLIRWLLLLPWRAINIANCQLGRNLYLARPAKFGPVRKPGWVVTEEAKNKNAEFWMYDFSPSETKNGYSVCGFLPRPLVEPLNCFVDKHDGYRRFLVGKKHVDTLFVSDHQSALSYDDLKNIFAQIGLEYAHKRLSPHSLRYIFAFEYILGRRGDYLTLSQCLWHHDPLTTLAYIGRFNISCSNQIIESWYKDRLSRVGLEPYEPLDLAPTYIKDVLPGPIFANASRLRFQHVS